MIAQMFYIYFIQVKMFRKLVFVNEIKINCTK